MIGIENISYYLPDEYINNFERLEFFDIPESFLQTKTGMLKVARKKANENTSDMCCKAVTQLLQQTELLKEDIQCMLVCTQNPDGLGLPHTSAIVHGKLDLPKQTAVFDVSLGCSGYVYSLSVLQGFMMVNGFTKGILVTADPYSKRINHNDKNTSLLFGDAATATLLSDHPKWTIGDFCFGSDGSQATAININSESGLIEMNGRAVFNFTATEVPRNVIDVLEKNQLAPEDVDLFLFHQGSFYIIDTLIKRLGLPEAKVPFMAAEYGNTVSSSLPLCLAMIPNDPKTIFISGFGVGLSWAGTILTRHNN
ncbi:ketoacyl-ACP synthase III [Legionella israelensis]|uniref:Ketoacyl-ACP synthase III n=1 Tax=Legionella israelensis TaxID=454 RepID=A0AAX1EHH3_9GAMM|nr:ketoacyl-ACP synthase III [Legionella israelensis]QBR84512.1 ketoacyl-ACP synthase III [Legionella israelensis]